MRFDDDRIADEVQRPFLCGSFPTQTGDAVLKFDHLVHDVLPTSLTDAWIAHQQVGPGDLEVDDRLLMGLVAGVEKAFGDRALLGLERFLPPRVVVLAPEDLAAPEHAVFRFHDSWW